MCGVTSVSACFEIVAAKPWCKSNMTKPARGSARSSKRPPRGGQTPPLQVRQKPRSSGDEAPGPWERSRAVTKAQQKWKPLSRSTVVTLDNMLGLSILSSLSLKRKENEEAQKHLNVLKDQFLATCSQLLAPAPKYSSLTQVSRQFQSESQKIKRGQRKVDALEESGRSVVSRLEELGVKRDRLEDGCRVLRGKLEEVEEAAQELLRLGEQNVLHLPVLPPAPHHEPTLQRRILDAVPDPHAVANVLQSSGVTGDLRAFLEHAQTDRPPRPTDL